MHAGAAGASALARQVCSRAWIETAATLKQDERSAVYRGEAIVAGVHRVVIVKTMRLNRIRDLFSRWFRRTRLMRQWRGAALLDAAGIPAARPFALFRGRDAGSRNVIETLVMEFVEGKMLLQYAAEQTPGCPEQRALARAVGSHAAGLLRAGLFNRDHKPSNIIAQRVPDGPDWRLVLIDTVGIRRAGAFSGAGDRGDALLATMLAKLWIECLGVGASVDRSLRWRVVLAACESRIGPGQAPMLARRLWREIHAVVRAHGDPRPKDDPLAPTPAVRSARST